MNESSSPTPPGLGRGLRAKLAEMRRRLVRIEVVRRGAIALCVALTGLAALLLADWLLDLPIQTRMGILIALGVVVAVLLLWALAAFVTKRRDDEPLALMVERAEPGFRSRLIASVQFARGKSSAPDPAASAMVGRLLEDTEAYAKGISFAGLLDARPLKRAIVAFVVLAALGTAGYFAGGAITQDLLKRAFLEDIPVPRATRVVWTSGDFKIGIGDAVTIGANVKGRKPPGGTLRIRYESGRRQEVVMAPGGSGAEAAGYRATIENVQESFTYVAAINDGRSERHRVRALPRPAVVSVAGRQTYPDYTDLPPTEHQPGEFLLFPGSELALTITASQPLRSGTVRLLGGTAAVESMVDASDPRLLRARFTAPDENLTGFTVELLDTEEMASRDATVYRVDILRDEPPTVRIVRPSRQRELVTPGALVMLGYEAEDRFGVEKLVLHYARNGGEARTHDLPIAQPGAKKVEETFDWRLGDLDPPLEVGDEVRIWIEAHDRNADTGTGTSHERELIVVTPREKREDLLSRVGDHLGRVEQATENQERLNDTLAEWIRAQAPLAAQEEPANDNPNDANDQ